jgi:hypothetical protein
LENDSKDECGVLEVDIEEVQGEDMETWEEYNQSFNI